MQVFATLYARNGSEIQIRRKHNYYTIWHGQQQIDGASARNQSDAYHMAHFIVSQINNQ